MKLIGTINGVSGYSENQDEYMPERLAPVADVIRAVREKYQFMQFPPAGMPVGAAWNFGHGRFATNDNTVFGITQLVMSPKGDSVATANTDQSDLVLDDLVDFMDSHFGYRIRQSHMTKIYWSHVVVEFDRGIEDYIEKIATIENLLRKFMGEKQPVKIKSVAFGKHVTALTSGDPIDFLSAQDFVIERRVEQPFEANRYFSSAPLRTTDHIRALQDIENAIR